MIGLPWEPANGEWADPKVGASARALVISDFTLSPYAEQADCGAWALMLTRPDNHAGLQWDVEVAAEHVTSAGTQVTITVSRRAFEGRAPRFEDVSVVAPRLCEVLLHGCSSPNVPRLPQHIAQPADVAALLDAIVSTGGPSRSSSCRRVTTRAPLVAPLGSPRVSLVRPSLSI
ncbi:MAG: hypothetical protein V4529_14295 [Gemmatimonadota bacterium]